MTDHSDSWEEQLRDLMPRWGGGLVAEGWELSHVGSPAHRSSGFAPWSRRKAAGVGSSTLFSIKGESKNITLWSLFSFPW